MKNNQPETLHELVQYINKYKDLIYVREKVGGKWGAYALTELPARLAVSHFTRFANQFVNEGRIPHRVK